MFCTVDEVFWAVVYHVIKHVFVYNAVNQYKNKHKDFWVSLIFTSF